MPAITRPRGSAEPVEHVDHVGRLGVRRLTEEASSVASGGTGDEDAASSDIEQLLAIARPLRLKLEPSCAIERYGRSAIDRPDQYLPAGNRPSRIRHRVAIRRERRVDFDALIAGQHAHVPEHKTRLRAARA